MFRRRTWTLYASANRLSLTFGFSWLWLNVSVDPRRKISARLTLSLWPLRRR
jgi:hypothetical protein